MLLVGAQRRCGGWYNISVADIRCIFDWFLFMFCAHMLTPRISLYQVPGIVFIFVTKIVIFLFELLESNSQPTLCIKSASISSPRIQIINNFARRQKIYTGYISLSGPKTGGERLPNAFLNNTKVGSMGSPTSTAKFALTMLSFHAVVLHVHAPEWVILGLFWDYLLWASVTEPFQGAATFRFSPRCCDLPGTTEDVAT